MVDGGIDGQPLWFEEYPIREFDVKNGDIFIERNKSWTKAEDENEKYYVLKIVSLNKDSIEVETIYDTEIFSYNKKEEVPSTIQTMDGPNWNYRVEFKKK